jgi:hypothetical protein
VSARFGISDTLLIGADFLFVRGGQIKCDTRLQITSVGGLTWPHFDIAPDNVPLYFPKAIRCRVECVFIQDGQELTWSQIGPPVFVSANPFEGSMNLGPGRGKSVATKEVLDTEQLDQKLNSSQMISMPATVRAMLYKCTVHRMRGVISSNLAILLRTRKSNLKESVELRKC